MHVTVMVGNPKAKSRTRAIGEGVAQLLAAANADVISLAGARSGDAGAANMSTR